MPDVTITPSENGPYIVSGPVVLDRPGRACDRASRPDGDVPLRTLLEQAVLRRHARHDHAHAARAVLGGPGRGSSPRAPPCVAP